MSTRARQEALQRRADRTGAMMLEGSIVFPILSETDVNLAVATLGINCRHFGEDHPNNVKTAQHIIRRITDLNSSATAAAPSNSFARYIEVPELVRRIVINDLARPEPVSAGVWEAARWDALNRLRELECRS